MVLMVDEAGYVKDVCSQSGRCFRRGVRMSKYNPDLCQVLIEHAKGFIGDKEKNEKRERQRNESEDLVMKTKVKEFREVIGSWFVTELVTEVSPLLEYEIKIEYHWNVQTRSVFYYLEIVKSQESDDGRNENEHVSILQGYFKRRVPADANLNQFQTNWKRKNSGDPNMK